MTARTSKWIDYPAGAGNLLPFGPTPPTPPPLDVQIGQDLDIYGLRTQYSF
jgi:hypothetical protein